VSHLKSVFLRIHGEERGQGATEYAIITVLVVAAVAAITLGLTGALNTAYQIVSNAITNAV